MGGWSDRLAAVLGWRAVAAGRRVLARYDAAGGSLLAGGLAYSALFAIVPLTVLAAGIVGLLVADEARQAEIVATIGNVLPPLREVVDLVLEEAAGAAGALSILGGVALLWGASRFVVAFEDAIRRIFGGSQRRNVVILNLAAFGAVVGLIVAAVVGAVLAGLASFLDAAEGRGAAVVGILADAALVAVPPFVAASSLALALRFVPVVAPTWRAILAPALVAGIVLAILARLFVFVAPRLIGAAATVGSLATAFAALAWLGLSFQAILLAAAWVRERDAGWGRTDVELEPEVLPGA